MNKHRPIKSIQNEMMLLSQELAAALAFDDAICLAIEERTGQPCADGADYGPADYDRAEQIFELYQRPD